MKFRDFQNLNPTANNQLITMIMSHRPEIRFNILLMEGKMSTKLTSIKVYSYANSKTEGAPNNAYIHITMNRYI